MTIVTNLIISLGNQFKSDYFPIAISHFSGDRSFVVMFDVHIGKKSKKSKQPNNKQLQDLGGKVESGLHNEENNSISIVALMSNRLHNSDL